MKAQPVTIYLPDTRGVAEFRYGLGNSKIGPGVYTYSRLPGKTGRAALGSGYIDHFVASLDRMTGTCPGATEECLAICYAARPVAEQGPVARMWRRNSMPDLPPVPEDCRLLRIHVGGDFDTVDYIDRWRGMLLARPDVTAWAYTRSWRVPTLLPALEQLRALPNVQLFASMDKSTRELPPAGWRRAWIDGDDRLGHQLSERNQRLHFADDLQTVFVDGTSSYVCPEETGRKTNCVECRYCFDGQHKDVTFLEHNGMAVKEAA